MNSAESSAGNLFWGMQFRRFGKSPQGTDSSPLSLCRFTKNYKSHTAITSIVDSALNAQNLGEKINQKNHFKSFCYFWLSPKVEPLLPLNPNLPNNADSAKSQNLVKNNFVRSTRNSPASWCKKSDLRLQKCNSRFFARSGESEALPLKAKKRSFLGTHFKKVGGSGAGDAALFAKELNKISGVRVAESNTDSANSQNLQNGLPHRFCESARNDENRDSSLASLSQNDNLNDFAESGRKSHKNKRIILW